ncbi:fructose permease [Levilactobacillus brevis]|uniref:fructose permease n=1 Tax=Levilactobacillus brevis TaxID=1580 RepID=UPI000A20671C|nr:fructose permease [Levilactobacillus brevis]ARN93807.1 fructose permease [Levilactobacillus brevis]ARN96377.1 fructose permease [Levilactobacillus brevis]
MDTMAVNSGRTISMGKAIAYFALSLVINSAGNVLTLVTSAKIHPSFLGAAYWSAAEANLGTAFHWNLFWAFLIMGFLTAVLNTILIHHWDWKRIAGNMVFMVPFSALIQVFEDFFDGKYPALFSGLPEARSLGMVILYVGLNFLGVAFIAVAISIYQRVNLVLHPADDLMQILRFRYFKGNAAKAMWASYIPPTIMAIVALVITRTFTNFGLGTIFAFLAQGGITGIADKVIFPRLKHQAVDVGQVKES